MLKETIRIKPILVITISHRLLMLKIIYTKELIIEHPRTQMTYINILTIIQLMLTNKINKTHHVKNTYYKFTNDAAINKNNTFNANGTYNVTKRNKLVNFNDNNYFTKK